jgi:hypothetical protein
MRGRDYEVIIAALAARVAAREAQREVETEQVTLTEAEIVAAPGIDLIEPGFSMTDNTALVIRFRTQAERANTARERG